ncbi:MAG TPA: FixH family protein [Fimbriimonas sp.]|nr:FixH family protein [Fimbriimonas sp.]
MLSLISSVHLVLFALQGQSATCAVTGEPVNASVAPFEWRGSKFEFCCPNCQGSFKADPAKFISIRADKNQAAGRYLFDPVTTARIDAGENRPETVYNGIRFVFASEQNKTAFLFNPSRYATYPAKEALYCPVGKEAVKDYSSASDYSDHAGVRYYMCCAGCKEAFEKEPTKYIASAASYIKSTQPEVKPDPSSPHIKRVGAYQIELRVPQGGIRAEEAMDIEFRLTDTRTKDAVEDGFKGVGGASATARVTMPSMPGMPAATPKVHREGVPGDYGVELHFPHAGAYDLDLSISIPGGEKVGVRFSLNVKDPGPVVPAAKPFKLSFVSAPKQAGKTANLKMKVVETATGKVQTAFDIAHEQRFHLLVVSKDLNWFLHEHPTMQKDGTWSIPLKLPAGTQYWVYGDVAPSGKGSQIISSQINVSGAKPKWSSKLAMSTTSNLPGVKGLLGSLQPLSVGESLTMQVKLFSTKKGKALPKITPWLGASGHMMIFHQDGQTVVHSHPVEGEEAADLLKRGIIRFSARFPRAGLYKVYAQCKIGGEIKTFGFGIKVTE